VPLYRFTCAYCGGFEARAGYDDSSISCVCGKPAKRESVYAINSVIVGQSLPRSDDAISTQQEWFKEVRKAGWSGERAIELMRHNVVEDSQGRKSVDIKAMNEATA